jgi:predicted dehydrogenase
MVARNGYLIRIGLLGYGYWGPNLARNIQASSSCDLAMIGDLSPERLAQAHRKHPGIRLTECWRDLVSKSAIDAVVIATPAHFHFEPALAALAAGKHVFLEKPITSTSAEAMRLMEEAERRERVLMVDHTFLFDPGVSTIRKVLSSGTLGRLTEWKSERTLGVVRRDVNVLWDLASHDLSILDHILPASPGAINATGSPSEQAACLTLRFPEGLTANIHVNWHGKHKVRRISIQGEAGVLVYDALDPVRTVTVTLAAHAGIERAIETETAEPLSRAIEHFISCIVIGGRPIAGGVEGWRVARLLEAADRSLHTAGQNIILDQAELVV